MNPGATALARLISVDVRERSLAPDRSSYYIANRRDCIL
jgi:hypothetical protein